MSLGVFKIALTTLLHSGKVTLDKLDRFGTRARLLTLSQFEANVSAMQRVRNLWDRLYPRISNYVELLLHSENSENSVAARSMERDLLFLRSTFNSWQNTDAGDEFSRLLVGKARHHLKHLFCLVMKQQANVTFAFGVDDVDAEGVDIVQASPVTRPIHAGVGASRQEQQWSAETELEQLANIITARWGAAQKVLAKRKGKPELRASQSTENLLANVSM